MSVRVSMSQWLDTLQSMGRYCFTRTEVESDTGRSFLAVQSALRRLKERKRVVSPRRGFYVVVSPEYRVAGAPPASWFIDELMQTLGQPYYVGLLSAAAIHGAAHQQPMLFQVLTSKPTRMVRAGNVTIEFSMSSRVGKMPVTLTQTETGTMRVASAETVAFDLVRYQAAAGHLSHVATVLTELADSIDVNKLVDVAVLVRIPDVQRLGYLLGAIGREDLARPLADWLGSRSPRAVSLRPGKKGASRIDKRWRVRPNVELEVDL